MDWEMWLELSVLIVLLGLFIYMFVFGPVTKLHRVYLTLHLIFMSWPMFQFIAMTMPDNEFRLFYLGASYIGLSLQGIGWLIFTIMLTGQSPYAVRKSRLFVLALPALLCAAAAGINPNRLFLDAGQSLRNPEAGPLFWLMVAQLAVYTAVSLFILAHTLRRAASVPQRKIALTAMTGLAALVVFAVTDLAVNVSFMDGRSYYVPLTSIGLVIVSLYLVHAITRQKAFDLIQIAQRDVMNTIPTGILVLDEQEVIVDINRTFRKLSHLRIGDKFNPSELADRLQVADKDAFLSFFKAQQDNKQDGFELEIAMYAQQLRYIVVQSVPIRNQRRMPIGRLISFQNITELRMLIEETNSQNELLHERNVELMEIQEELFLANKKLEHMAVTDALTGCYNRRYLVQQLEREVMVSLEYGTPFSIIMFDIDLFKSINDTYGHLIGDVVLQETVKAVRDVLRASDILARYGGEEFTVYLPHTTREQADFVAQRIKEAVEHNQMSIGDNGSTVSVTISIGIVSLEMLEGYKPQDMKRFIDLLFEQADSALYEAKFSGRNRIVNRKLA